MITLALACAFSMPDDSGWKTVSTGITRGISGMALVRREPGSATFAIVRDNKKPGENRIATLTVNRIGPSEIRELPNPAGEEPIDLEGIAAIPDKPGEFLVNGSAGKVFRLQLQSDRFTILGSFTLPALASGANLEGLSLAKVGSESILAWGERGKLPAKGTIQWCAWDAAAGAPTGPVNSFTLDLPWPTAETARGISDLKVDSSGAVFVTCAADFGDDGPFQSGLYLVGTVRLQGFQPAVPTRLFWTEGRKIEAVEFVSGYPGGMIFGTDDENMGAAIWHNFWIE